MTCADEVFKRGLSDARVSRASASIAISPRCVQHITCFPHSLLLSAAVPCLFRQVQLEIPALEFDDKAEAALKRHARRGVAQAADAAAAGVWMDPKATRASFIGLGSSPRAKSSQEAADRAAHRNPVVGMQRFEVAAPNEVLLGNRCDVYVGGDGGAEGTPSLVTLSTRTHAYTLRASCAVVPFFFLFSENMRGAASMGLVAMACVRVCPRCVRGCGRFNLRFPHLAKPGTPTHFHLPVVRTPPPPNKAEVARAKRVARKSTDPEEKVRNSVAAAEPPQMKNVCAHPHLRVIVTFCFQ